MISKLGSTYDAFPSCEGWGWYVDIENTTPVVINSYSKINKFSSIYDKNKTRSNYRFPKYLSTRHLLISNYDYDVECDQPLDSRNSAQFTSKHDKSDLGIRLFRICSETIVCALMTYVVFYLI